MAFFFTLTVAKSNLKHSFLSNKKQNLLWLFWEEEYSSELFCVLGNINYIQYEINDIKPSLLLNKYLCWKILGIFYGKEYSLPCKFWLRLKLLLLLLLNTENNHWVALSNTTSSLKRQNLPNYDDNVKRERFKLQSWVEEKSW